MSRLLIKPISVPNDVSASVVDSKLSLSGFGVSKTFQIPSSIDVKINESSISIDKVVKKSPINGTFYANVRNSLLDISKSFSCELIMTGVEYKASISGSMLFVSIGYSHDSVISVPQGVTVAVSGQVITISGRDRLVVSQFASQICSLKKPEPYKGKGIRRKGQTPYRKAVKSNK